MEYLKTVEQKASMVDESEYEFFTITDFQKYLFGVSFADEKGFYKIKDLDSINSENGDGWSEKCLLDTNYHTSGIRLRLSTDSDAIIIKVQMKRKYAHQKMTTYCSSGFDIYWGSADGTYEHKTVVAAKEPNNCFAEKISTGRGKFLQIYFPLYNSVEKMLIGIKKGCSFCDACHHSATEPIMFYGNSITQGASASRSGNAYPNIVNRLLNIDIFNYSFSGACRAELAMARQICNRKYCAIVIDYSRNAKSIAEFKERYEPFYFKLREYYPSIPVVLVGAYNAPVYDTHIMEVYKSNKKKGDNLFFVDLRNLFKGFDPVTFSLDNIHYTDQGMFMVAEKIAEILREALAIGDVI